MNIKPLLFTVFLFTGPVHAIMTGSTNRADIVHSYCKILERKLQGVPQKDRDAIIRGFQQELRSYSNAELFNQHTIDFAQATIITTYAKTKAEQEARKHSSNRNVIEDFAALWLNHTIQKIENNESLDGLFDHLEASACRYFNKPTPSYSPTQPTPSAPPMKYSQHPHHTTIQHIYYATEHDKKRLTDGTTQLDTIVSELFNKGLSNRTITRFNTFFLKSIQANQTLPVIPPTPHTQNAFVEIFNYELDHLKHKLRKELSASTLEKAIAETRQSLIPTVKQLTPSSAERFQHILSTLEDTVIENAGIACPICTETYKNDDAFGSVEKITLQEARSAKTCHSACKTCIQKRSLNSCPECRKTIDQHDLRTKMSQPSSPANWRP